MKTLFSKTTLATASAAMLMAGLAFNAEARIEGIEGAYSTVGATTTATFNLEVSAVSINTPDGDTFKIWGYGPVGGVPQYPGPTLKIKAGHRVVINLANKLPNLPNTVPAAPMPVSMVFPGQSGVTATGGTAGLLTAESTGATDIVTYTIDAANVVPGTYMYHSGTRPGLQVEMGLVGAMIVYPGSTVDINNPSQAYDTADSAFDHEYLFLLTEMDPTIHYMAEFGLLGQINNAVTKPVLWFINGRNGPDTLFADYASYLPNQPYSSLTRMHPGENILMRVVGGGREQHPFHTHGNNYTQIARDGRLLTTTGTSADLAFSDYTLVVTPGSTHDALFTWTGAGMGWDIYGHGEAYATEADCLTDPAMTLEPAEDPASHCKKLPVVMPENTTMTFGGFWRGSPFIGAMGDLPPGEGGLNLNGGMVFMWHSHTEKELANNDIFPGGMLTMLIIEPHGVPIP